MHLKTLFKIILSILVLNSCKPSGNEYFTFDPLALKENEITLSDIADNVTYLPLPNNFPISKANKFTFTDQLIYLWSDQGILVFNREENQLRNIGSKGRGPGEYLLSSFFLLMRKPEKFMFLIRGTL